MVTSEECQTTIRIGKSNHQVANWLKLNHASCSAFLTAFNPESRILTDQENQQRHQSLQQLLKQRSTNFLEGYGKGREGNWPAETSVLIAGDSPRAFNELATKYNQAAYVLIDSVGYAAIIEKSAYSND